MSIQPYIAAAMGHIQIVKILLDAGADIHAETAWGGTPFHSAASGGHKDVAELLLQKGSVLDKKDNSGRTPFYSAAESAKANMAIWLLERAADPNIDVGSGDAPPIIRAAIRGQTALIEALIKHNADIKVTDRNGWTSLHGAAMVGNVKITRLLLEAGSDVNAVDTMGRTPLHGVVDEQCVMALSSERTAVIDMLVRHGADVGRKDSRGRTPIDIAERTLQIVSGEGYSDNETKSKFIDQLKEALKRLKMYAKNPAKAQDGLSVSPSPVSAAFASPPDEPQATTQIEELVTSSESASQDKVAGSGSEQPEPKPSQRVFTHLILYLLIGLSVFTVAGLLLLRRR